jgi:hypothetical protein
MDSVSKVIPEIKGFFSSDVGDLSTLRAERAEDVYFPLDLSIGPKGDRMVQLFEVLVATPEALRKRAGNRPYVLGRHHLIVMEYDWPKIQNYLRGLVQSCASNTWEEVAARLSRHFHWEYEDYVQEE